MMKPTKSQKLYNGKIIIDFYEKTHWYKVRGIKGVLTSVTGATGLVSNTDALMGWAVKMSKEYLLDLIGKEIVIGKSDVLEASSRYREKRKRAANIGSEVHDWIERYIKNKIKGEKKPEYPKDQKVMNGIIAFLKWTKKHQVKFIESEKLVYSKKWGYVGTLDCKAMVDGVLTLLDFKTSNYISDEMRFQVSAYLHADKEESGDVYQNRIILQIGKDTGGFKDYYLAMDSHEDDFTAFIGLLAVKTRKKQLKREESKWKK